MEAGPARLTVIVSSTAAFSSAFAVVVREPVERRRQWTLAHRPMRERPPTR
jgi:hypothetical protein